MRSYNQQCALAKALDLIGDRWTLLIVRELMLTDGCRYTDLQAGLPGIATNLLATRLREMEANGILTKEDAPPPVATALFRLTQRGWDLEPVFAALGNWGAPLLDKRLGGKNFRTRLLQLPLRLDLTGKRGIKNPAVIVLRTGNEPLTLTARESGVETQMTQAAAPDLVLSGEPHPLLALLLGRLTLEQARGAGVKAVGNTNVLAQLERKPAA